MKLVYFVRHGESVGNTGSTFQGPDSPLTEKGRSQATVIAERVAQLPIEAMLTSTMARTRETAEIIGQNVSLPLELSDLFVERQKPTALYDQPRTDTGAQKLNDGWESSLFVSGAKVEDGENFDELKERARNAIALLEARPEENLLVVTHGFFLRMLVAYIFFGEELDGQLFRHFIQGLETSNTGLTVVEHIENPPRYRKAWRLITWNDHAHLADPTS